MSVLENKARSEAEGGEETVSMSAGGESEREYAGTMPSLPRGSDTSQGRAHLASQVRKQTQLLNCN